MCADIFAPAPVAPSFASAAHERLLNGSQTGLHTPAVRDLAWLMTSSPLLSRAAFGSRLADPFDDAIFGADARHRMHRLLQRLDAAPQPLMDALAVTGERRLGRYAERLLAVWLAQSEGIELTASGLPVRDPREGGRTLGECDALFRTVSGSSQHWELAVKFFLFIDDPRPAAAKPMPSTSTATRTTTYDDPLDPLDTLLAGCDAYVGAGLADRFDWKLRRLIEHQLPLSAHPELLAIAPGPWQASMFVKGRLFYPLAHWHDPLGAIHGGFDGHERGDGSVRASTAIAEDHPRGWWATLDTWLSWSEASPCLWTHLARLDWLAPLRVEADRTRDAKSFADEIRAQFASGMPSANMPRQVAALHPASHATSGSRGAEKVEAAGAGSDALQVELSRGFIVPNEWPERARRFRRSGL